MGRRRRVAVLAFLGAACLTLGVAPRPAEAQRGRLPAGFLEESWRLRRDQGSAWVLTGVHVVDVRRGVLLEDVDVVVRGDRIESVGDAGFAEGLEEVEGAGGYVIPGLFDLHAHIQAVGLTVESAETLEVCATLLRHGVTTVRELPLTTEFAVHLSALTSKGTIAGPAVIPASSLFEKQPERSSMGFGDPATARAWVEREALAGARWIKVYNSMDADSLRVIVQTARRHGLQVCGHTELVPPREASELGIASVEHTVSLPLSCLAEGADRQAIAGLSGLIDWRWRHLDDAACRGLLETFRHNDTAWVPTLVVIENMIAQGGHDGAGAMSPEVAAGLEQSIARAAEFAVEQFRAGGLVGLGTDFPVDGTPPGESAHRELELLVDEGTASPLEALQIGTLRSATILGVEELLGTVEVGRVASFVVLDDDPLEDIGAVRSIRLVVHQGRRITP